MAWVSDIYNFFEMVAKNHPKIAHDETTNPAFYGWNFDELISEEKSNIGYPCLGLSMPTHSGLKGSFNETGTSIYESLYVHLTLLDKVIIPSTANQSNNEYQEEYDIYDRLYLIIQDIIAAIYRTVQSEPGCDWRIIKLIDLSNVAFERVGPLANNDVFGWRVTLHFKNILNIQNQALVLAAN